MKISISLSFFFIVLKIRSNFVRDNSYCNFSVIMLIELWFAIHVMYISKYWSKFKRRKSILHSFFCSA